MPEIWKFDAPDPYASMQVGMAQSRANRIADMELAQKVRAEEQTKALNELMKTAVDPITGKVDVNRLAGGMAKGGYGTAVPDLLKTYAGLREAQGKADEQTGKAVLERMKMYRDLLPSDPAKAASWARAAHNDTVIGPYLGQMGSVEDTIAKIPTDPKEYQKWYNQMGLSVDDAIKRSTVTAEAMLPYTQPKSSEVYAQELGRAGAGKTSISIPISTGKKFGETIAEQAGNELGNMQKQAQAGLEVQDSIRRLQPLLNNKDFISGTLGDARLAVAKALGLPGAEETQAYFAGIGDQVAARVKAFGSGTGISDADRKFAEKIAGGSIELTPEAIKRIVRINDETAARSVKSYNERRKFLAKSNPEIENYFPELTPKSAMGGGTSGPAVGTVQDGYRFKGGFAGDPANWEKVK